METGGYKVLCTQLVQRDEGMVIIIKISCRFSLGYFQRVNYIHSLET